jgi:hypothetical protein
MITTLHHYGRTNVSVQTHIFSAYQLQDFAEIVVCFKNPDVIRAYELTRTTKRPKPVMPISDNQTQFDIQHIASALRAGDLSKKHMKFLEEADEHCRAKCTRRGPTGGWSLLEACDVIIGMFKTLDKAHLLPATIAMWSGDSTLVDG